MDRSRRIVGPLFALFLVVALASTFVAAPVAAAGKGTFAARGLTAASEPARPMAAATVRPLMRDAYEPDEEMVESWFDATVFFADTRYRAPIGSSTLHNFEDAFGTHEYDVDYMWFDTVAGRTYTIFTNPYVASTDPWVYADFYEWDSTYSEWVPSLDGDGYVGVDDRLNDDTLPNITMVAPSSGKCLIAVGHNTDIASQYELWVEDKGVLPAGTVNRIGGANRYAVAKQVAHDQFGSWAGRSDIIITSGLDRASCDPLAATGLAGTLDAPILLVNQDSRTRVLPGETRSAITLMRDANSPGASYKFWIVGGTRSVPDWVKTRIRAIIPAAQFERISGRDRYACAAAVAKRIGELRVADALPAPDTAFIANGETPAYFFSALVIGPTAYKNKLPLLLTRKLAVPGATSSQLTTGGYANRYVVGSPYDVANGTVTALGATRYGSAWPSGMRGYNRYRVARIVAETGAYLAMTNCTPVIVASKVPDALTGGCLAGSQNGVLLYTDYRGVERDLSDYMNYWRYMSVGSGGGYPDVTICGGPPSVSSYAEWRLNWLAGTIPLLPVP